MKKFLTVLSLTLITMVLSFQPNVNLLSYKSITYRVTIEDKTALTTLQIEKGKEGLISPIPSNSQFKKISSTMCSPCLTFISCSAIYTTQAFYRSFS